MDFFPSVIIGIPLGTCLIRLLDPETFRRICVAFDALVVGFVLSRVVVELDLASVVLTYSLFSVVAVINDYLLFRFFRWRPEPGSTFPQAQFPSARYICTNR